MHNDDEGFVEYDDTEKGLFAELPREASVDPTEFDRLMGRMRSEGLFHGFARARAPLSRTALFAAAAAAVLLFSIGVAVGSYNARRGSLEDMLSRRELSIGDRVLLLQRAGSAYVRAAQSYADATANVDSSAIEVASKVLMGAAHAVARNSLDAGLSARLTIALQPPVLQPVSINQHPVIWY